MEPYVFLVAVLAGASAVAAYAVVVQPGVAWSLPTLALFGAFSVGYFLLQRRGFVLHWRRQRIVSTIDEPMVYLSIVTLPYPSAILVVLVGSALSQALSTRRPLKSLFNLGAYTLATAAACVAYAGALQLGLPPVLAGVPAVFSYTLASNVLLAGIFSRVEGEPLLRVFRQRFLVSTPLHGILGGSLGVAAIVMWSYHPAAVLLLTPMTLLAVGFAKLDAGAEREIAVRRQLAQMEQQLVLTSDEEAVVEQVLQASREIFLAGRTRVALAQPDGGLREWARAFEGGAREVTPLSAPIVGRSGVELGRIDVWPSAREREPFGDGERPLLDIVAGRAATAVERARGMRETLDLKNLHEGIVQNVPAGVVRVDRAGRILQANAHLLRALGGESPPAPRESVFSWRPLRQVPEFDRAIQEALAGRPFHDLELRLPDARGTTLSASGVALPDGGAVVLLSDVTAQRQAAEALRSQTLTRPFVRRLVLSLVGGLNVPREAIASVGRSLAREVALGDMSEFAAAFREMGLGNLQLDRVDDGKYHFSADDLLEKRVGASQPTCHLALGFLEGAVAAAHGGSSLGTELRCQSKGHARCVFVVQPRENHVPVVAVRRPGGVTRG